MLGAREGSITGGKRGLGQGGIGGWVKYLDLYHQFGGVYELF